MLNLRKFGAMHKFKVNLLAYNLQSMLLLTQFECEYDIENM